MRNPPNDIDGRVHALRLLRVMEDCEVNLSILDVGCGNGWSTEQWAVGSRKKVVAMDRVRMPPGNYYRVVGDMHHLPFKYGVFDVVTGTGCWHHTHVAWTLAQARWTLGVEGIIVLANEAMTWFLGYEGRRPGIHADEHAYRYQTWRMAIHYAGLRVIKERLYPLRLWLPALRWLGGSISLVVKRW